MFVRQIGFLKVDQTCPDNEIGCQIPLAYKHRHFALANVVVDWLVCEKNDQSGKCPILTSWAYHNLGNTVDNNLDVSTCILDLTVHVNLMDMETPQGYSINLSAVTERSVRAVSVLRWNLSHLYGVSRGLDVPDLVFCMNVKEVLNPRIQLRNMEGSLTKQIIGIFQISTKCYWLRTSPDISSLVCFWGQTCRPSVPEARLLAQINLVEVQWKVFYC